MGNPTGKGKHKVIVRYHPPTNMISKPVIIVKREEYNWRKWELHLKIRNQKLKRTLYIYRLLLSIIFLVIAMDENQWSIKRRNRADFQANLGTIIWKTDLQKIPKSVLFVRSWSQRNKCFKTKNHTSKCHIDICPVLNVTSENRSPWPVLVELASPIRLSMPTTEKVWLMSNIDAL